MYTNVHMEWKDESTSNFFKKPINQKKFKAYIKYWESSRLMIRRTERLYEAFSGAQNTSE